MHHIKPLWDNSERALDAMQDMVRRWRFGYGGFYLDFADFLDATLDNVAVSYVSYVPKWRIRLAAWILRSL